MGYNINISLNNCPPELAGQLIAAIQNSLVANPPKSEEEIRQRIKVIAAEWGVKFLNS